ncbi:type III-B CRISPR module RAMP protein Cmr1 [Haliscomenobacter hydrossis]|uniref:CRISPR-associated protein TM1795 family protein n=1 Tax=Haliscomenobacter hydrossis (strain ATCC 27775 / DSM 1100 / LMG 10767 / O) TaxID=760192 RepID=F4L2J5_HALH1|nr:type III-B CRISPR module RAMP protein Cmr1 [Haliscomenobacter hydrossis]AEE53913.1 CRISPR-associated protein TM1795 family protein [Haliscomenobacter hydrossis DSM 1100]
METITFLCKTITPMFIAGADGKTLEFRASSLKGAMRFWWRAFNAHIRVDSDVSPHGGKLNEGLRDIESRIFGGAGSSNVDAKRSSFSIQVMEIGRDANGYDLLPHRPTNSKLQAFLPASTFQVIIRIPENYRVVAKLFGDEVEVFNRDRLVTLFQLTSILGGMGKRVRRGMGSWQITSATIDQTQFPCLENPQINDIFSLVKILTPHYDLHSSGSIVMNFSGRMDKYPWVRKIEIGKKHTSADSLLYDISAATHLQKKPGLEDAYNASMGHAKMGRFASPIYVSVLPDNRSIVTTLNTIPDRDIHLSNPNIQDQFKKSFL